MNIGYLAFSILGAVFSSIWAVLSGFSFLAVFGFYVMGGMLSMMVLVGAALCWHLAQNPNMHPAKA